MKAKSILSTVAAAAAGFAITLALFWPGNLTAVDQGKTAKLTPKLTVDGVEVTLEPVQPDLFKTGEQPVLRFRAMSMEGRPGKFTVMLAMTSLDPGSSESRIGPMERTIWQDMCPVEVSVDQPFSKIIPTYTKLPAGSEIKVRMAPLAEAAADKPAATQPAKVRPFRGLGKGEVVALAFTTERLPAPVKAGGPATQPAR